MQTMQQKPWIDLKKLREARGWQQSRAAEKLGFARSYLALVENGKQGISINMVNAIMRVFDVKYEDFYRESNDGS